MTENERDKVVAILRRMKQCWPTRETFAWWSLERDQAEACKAEGEDDVIVVSCREDLDQYLEEADLYLSSDPSEWPTDILEKIAG